MKQKPSAAVGWGYIFNRTGNDVPFIFRPENYRLVIRFLSIVVTYKIKIPSRKRVKRWQYTSSGGGDGTVVGLSQKIDFGENIIYIHIYIYNAVVVTRLRRHKLCSVMPELKLFNFKYTPGKNIMFYERNNRRRRRIGGRFTAYIPIF